MSPKISMEKPVSRNKIHSAREKKQNRIVVIGFVITAILIVGLVGYAFLYDLVIKDRTPVAVVNNIRIDNKYFQDRVRLERNRYAKLFESYYAQYQLLAGDPATAELYQSQLIQLQQMLDNSESLAKTVLDRMVDEEILNQKAAELGISVSDTEVEEAIQGLLFGYYPNGTPTPAPTFPPVSTPTPSQAQLGLLGYTPTPISENPDITETLAETQQAVTPTATTGPTATPYTNEFYENNYQAYIAELSGINVSETSIRKSVENYILVQKVRSEIIKDVPREQEQVWARHILVKTEPEALSVKERLANGEDWSLIAADVSLDTSNKDKGGDLGWFTRGRMVESFENAAFALEQGQISEPVESQFGFHIIQLVGKTVQPLSDGDFESLQEIQYQKWFQELRGTAEIKINEVWKELAPKEPTYQIY